MGLVCSFSQSPTRHMTGLISGVWRPSQDLDLLFVLPETLHVLVLFFSHGIFPSLSDSDCDADCCVLYII